MIKGSILIIDDEEKILSLLSRIIGLEGYTVSEAHTAKDGLKKLEKEDIQVVITDVKLPDATGIELTGKIKSLYPHIELIVLTAYGTIADGVKAIKNGAFDYITKGNDNDKIIPLLARAMDKALLQKRVQQLEKKISKKYSFDSIIGESTQIRNAVEMAKKVAGTDATVLITGETGTGKEVFAQAIHYTGKRHNRNFVAVNCSAFSKDILESELFGHRAGAYTGATKDTKGLFEEADGGTIFLDEIGEMSIELQSKLLRVLETNEFIKVGDSKTTKVDVRVIAATNRDLQKETDREHFRSDLFYRLAVFQVALPALRERTKDIKPLAEHFLQLFAGKVNKPVPKMTKEFVEKLISYPWKGNIRELKNIMERTVILSDKMELTVDELPFEIKSSNGDGLKSSAYSLTEVEKQHIKKVLEHTKGNKTEAARLMGIGLTTLYRKLEEYKLS
ncbi:MAG TPA: sigma-54 dependent transcriptional regulator [Bacteroidia bacterium]|jgi:two-component system NtrC family response regulator|nr:sigma-54 dependent transcriptional regulator [Bacteroidia bacterium]